MKFKTNILFCVFLLVSVTVFGQKYTFKVLANKGANEVKSGNDWRPLKIGASLMDNDELKLSNGAYLGLMHSSGKTVELKDQSGSMSVKELASKVDTKNSSVASKYADFVLSKIGDGKKESNLKATGAVDRGGFGNQKIVLHAPKSVDVYNALARIEWENTENEEGVEYKVVVKDMFNEEIKSFTTKETFVELDLNEGVLAKQKNLLVTIGLANVSDKNAKNVAIKKLSQDKATIIQNDLNQIVGEESEMSALNAYILGGFYEQNGLLLDALFYYEQAIQKAPEVDSYKDAYEEFLFRNNMK